MAEFKWTKGFPDALEDCNLTVALPNVESGLGVGVTGTQKKCTDEHQPSPGSGLTTAMPLNLYAGLAEDVVQVFVRLRLELAGLLAASGQLPSRNSYNDQLIQLNSVLR